MPLHIACYQQDIVANNPSANYAKVRAAFEGIEADILVVPETFTAGFGGDMAATAEAADGPTLDFARKMAAEHQALFVGTWCVREGAKTYNRMHWVLPDGSHGHYDKRHLFRLSTEREQLTQGTDSMTFAYKGWRIRPAICYDLRFPTWLRNRDNDYDLLMLCANWPASRSQAWSLLLRARAIENQCFVVGTNRCGTDFSGDSMIVDYQGNPIAQATAHKEHVISALIDKNELDTYRYKWPFYLDAD